MTLHPVTSRKRRGATLVETAVVISACLLFVFGIFEYGRFVMVRNLIDNAAREGARYAVVNTADVTLNQIQDLVDQYLAGQGRHLDNYNKTTSIKVYKADATGNNVGLWTDASFGEYICVEITGTYRPILPSFLQMPATITVQTKAMMYSEAN